MRRRSWLWLVSSLPDFENLFFPPRLLFQLSRYSFFKPAMNPSRWVSEIFVGLLSDFIVLSCVLLRMCLHCQDFRSKHNRGLLRKHKKGVKDTCVQLTASQLEKSVPSTWTGSAVDGTFNVSSYSIVNHSLSKPRQFRRHWVVPESHDVMISLIWLQLLVFFIASKNLRLAVQNNRSECQYVNASQVGN